MFRQMIDSFLSSSSASKSVARRSKNPRRRSLRLEALENRELLSLTTPGLDDVSDASPVEIVGAETPVLATTDDSDSDALLVETVENASDVTCGAYDATARSVKLSWVDDSSDETGFRIERSKDGGKTWSLALITGRDVTSRTVYGIEPNAEYSFRVCALRGSKKGDWAYSDPLKTTVNLDAPSDVATGEYDATSRSVSVSWKDNSNSETGFRVEYSTDGGKSWSLSQITGRNVTSRTVYGVKPNAEYTFRVCALRGSAKSDWASSETLKTTVNLNAPSDVTTGKYDATTRTVTLNWKDNSNNETGFRIEYSTDGGKKWRLAQITGRNVTSRTVYGVAPDSEYTFRVCAIRGADQSDRASSEKLNTASVFTAPSDLSFGSYNAKKRRVTLSWTDNSNNETGFRIEYSTDGGKKWRLSQITGANVTSRTVYGIGPNSEYTFRVCAIRGAKTTDRSYSETLDTGATPAAPSEATLGEYDAEAKTVAVSWKDNSKDETGFQVEYTTDDGKTWSLAEKTDADVTSITAKDVQANKTYQFRVAALRNNLISAWTYSEELDTSVELVAPSDVTLGEYAAEEKTVSVSWKDNSKDETGFQVEYTTDDGETWSLAGKVDADVTSYAVSNVEANKTYRFRVAAIREEKYSAWAYSEDLVAKEEDVPQTEGAANAQFARAAVFQNLADTELDLLDDDLLSVEL